MKRLKILMMIILPLWSCVACAAGKTVNVTLKVVHEDNQTVADAKVAMGFLLSHGSNSFRGSTDEDGIVEATNKAMFGVSIRVTKDNYYKTGLRTGYGDQDLTVVLREKKNPIAMYAKRNLLVVLKEMHKIWIGYDLEKGDFLPPYGSGIKPDFEVWVEGDDKDFWTYSSTRKIRFPNPSDGFIPFYAEHNESTYKSGYMAPESGYKNEWSYYRYRKGQKFPIETNYEERRNYYFRVRTETDKDGNIQSAYYGKIYGDMGGEIYHYFNPMPNDRNVEFDPQKNLFKNLTNEQKVGKP